MCLNGMRMMMFQLSGFYCYVDGTVGSASSALWLDGQQILAAESCEYLI